MTITVNTKTFKLHRALPDSSVYKGPANTLAKVDILTFKRVMPKPSNDFTSVGRPSIKRTRDVTVDAVSGKTRPAVLELTGSLPLGITAAEVTELMADLTAAAIAAGVGKALFEELDLPTA